jgi:5-methyltetrahydrofolate--homocysteine methyltransferase
VIFDLLDAENNTGITLTENFAMLPAASVSGYYFSHPSSRYFNIEKISHDQVKSYAQRKQIAENDVEIYLAQNINL